MSHLVDPAVPCRNTDESTGLWIKHISGRKAAVFQEKKEGISKLSTVRKKKENGTKQVASNVFFYTFILLAEQDAECSIKLI